MTPHKRIDPRQYVVRPDAEITDVDLDREDFRSGGRRLTEERAELLAARASRGRGRPSLTGHAARSPQVTARVTPALRARLQARADAEHERLSDVVREAIEHDV